MSWQPAIGDAARVISGDIVGRITGQYGTTFTITYTVSGHEHSVYAHESDLEHVSDNPEN